MNDFAIKLANVNGTGSASANSLLMQAIFRMGIPVSGKNLFPSNIQGLPTWYEIRVNKSGYTARALDYDLMVAMNSQTYAEDIADVRHGGYVLYDSSWPLDPDLLRDDVTFLGVPLAKMCLENFAAPRERILMKNIAYAGAVVALRRHRPRRWSPNLLAETFARNEALARVQPAAPCASATTTRWRTSTCPLAVPRRAHGRERRIRSSSTATPATALGCLYAGATVAGWYPITPATAVMDNFIASVRASIDASRRERRPDVPATAYQNNYLIIQAEDEIAAIGMVLGASLERRARLHLHVGTGHLADERTARSGVLHRDPGRDRRRAAHRTLDRDADAHPAGRHPAVRLRQSTATPSTSCCSPPTPTSASSSRSRASTSPSGSRRRSSCSRTSTSG